MYEANRMRLEEEIQALCGRGELGLAVEWTLRAYGDEIRGVVNSILPDARGQDAYSHFSERLLKGLPAFRWESSLRTWLYRMARNVCLKQLSASSRERPGINSSLFPEPAARERTETHPWQRTDVKERFRALRARLEPEDQELLALRVGQNLAWQQVARKMSGPEEPLTGAALARRVAALRQQFQRVKARLRTLAMEEGLFGGDDAEEGAPCAG